MYLIDKFEESQASALLALINPTTTIIINESLNIPTDSAIDIIPIYWNSVIDGAARGGHLNILNLAATKIKSVNWHTVACNSVEYGHLEIFNLACEHLRNKDIGKYRPGWDNIAFHAAKGGYLDILNSLFSKILYCSKDIYVDMCECMGRAARGAKIGIFKEILQKVKENTLIDLTLETAVTLNWDYILREAAKSGSPEMFSLALLESINSDYSVFEWNKISMSAVEGGNISIFNTSY